MNPRILKTALDRAEARAAELSGDEIPDRELARRFVATRDETAFRWIVHRHGGLVWNVCRRSLANANDADDAFQAVFLVLIQSKAKLLGIQSLAAWLHGIAVRVCLKARRSAMRTRLRDQKAAQPEGTVATEPDWNELHAAVHEEVQRLPEALRTAFVLCELEGVRQPEAANRLGWKLGTLSGRLTRARQALMKRLTSRGLAPGLAIAASGGLLPEALAARLHTVFAFGVGDGISIPSTVLTLARAATEVGMGRSKILIAAGALALGLFGGTAWLATADGQAPGGIPGGPGAGGPPGSGTIPLGGPPGVTPGVTVGPPGGVSAPAAKAPEIEYRTEPVPNDSKEFTKLLNDMQKQGWEYMHPVTLVRGQVQDVSVLVFKKGPPKPVAVPSGGMGSGPMGPGSGSGGFGGPSGGIPSRRPGTADGSEGVGGMLPPISTEPGLKSEVQTIKLEYSQSKLVVSSILGFYPECQATAISDKSFLLKCQNREEDKAVMKLVQEIEKVNAEEEAVRVRREEAKLRKEELRKSPGK